MSHAGQTDAGAETLSLTALSLTPASPPEPADEPPLPSTSSRSERRKRAREYAALYKAALLAEDSRLLVRALCEWQGLPPRPQVGGKCHVLMQLALVCLDLGMHVAGGLVRDSLAGIEPNDLDVDLYVQYGFEAAAAEKAAQLAAQVYARHGIKLKTLRVASNVLTLRTSSHGLIVEVQIANAVAFERMNEGRPRFDVDNLVIRSGAVGPHRTTACRYEGQGLRHEEAVDHCKNRCFKSVQDPNLHRERIREMEGRGWTFLEG